MERRHARDTQLSIFALRPLEDGSMMRALADLDVTWMVAPQSILTFSPVLHDIYVFGGEAVWNEAGRIYQWLRARDRNAPAIFVRDGVDPDAILERTRDDPRAYVASNATPHSLRLLVHNLAEDLRSHALQARSAELMTIRRELQSRLHAASDTVNAARQSLVHAEERLAKASALPIFAAGGGTNAQFERLWPGVFEEALNGKR